MIEKCTVRDQIRESKAASFPIKDDPKTCNFWMAGDSPLNTAPWTKDCLIYQYDNACNKYQISRDGKKVVSCDVPAGCIPKKIEPSCIQEYPPRNYSQPLFPAQGQQCFFRESVYPIKPWPRGCKVYQAGNSCNSYEISDEGNYVNSCDLAMKFNECLAPNVKTHVCV